MCAICIAAVWTGLSSSSFAIQKVANKFHFQNVFTPKNIYKAALIILTLYCALPILAPILEKLGLTIFSSFIYNLYFIFCHQRASHSFHIFDLQFAYCARDTFIWVSIAIMAFLKYRFNYKTIPIKWVIALSIPMAIDGGVQFVSILLNSLNSTPIFYESTNLQRAATGTLFGIAVGGSLFSYLFDNLDIKNLNQSFKSTKKAILITIILSVVLFILIDITQLLTCNIYKPAGLLDSSPRNYGYKLIEEPRLLHK